MNWTERSFLALVLLVGAGVILLTLNAVGVPLPFLSSEPANVDEDDAWEDVPAPLAPPDDTDEGLLAELEGGGGRMRRLNAPGVVSGRDSEGPGALAGDGTAAGTEGVPDTVVEDGEFTQRMEFWLRDWLRQEDIFDYGIGPQFLARFDAMVLLDDLDAEALAKIFTFAPDSGYRKAQTYFESRQTRLTLTEDAVMRIAREAGKSPRLGARALGEVFRRVIRNYEFEPERFANENRAIIIDTPDVEPRSKR